MATFLVGFCVLFSLVGVFTYVTFHLAAPPYSLLPGALGSIFFVYLAGVVMTPLAGRAIDRFGHRSDSGRRHRGEHCRSGADVGRSVVDGDRRIRGLLRGMYFRRRLGQRIYRRRGGAKPGPGGGTVRDVLLSGRQRRRRPRRSRFIRGEVGPPAPRSSPPCRC